MSGFEAHDSGAKKRDYWWTVLFTDPIALPMAKFLTKHRWLTPDQVTVIALLLGVASGVLLGLGLRWGLIAGGITFYLAFIVDCVDGKLARALGVTSERGKALDALADGARRASASLGLFVYLWRTAAPRRLDLIEGDSVVQYLFSIARPPEVLLVVVYIVLAYYFLEISGAEKGETGTGVRGRWSVATARRRLLPNPGMPDVQAIVFIIGPITGLIVPTLWMGVAMVSVAILLTVRRRLRTGPRQRREPPQKREPRPHREPRRGRGRWQRP